MFDERLQPLLLAGYSQVQVTQYAKQIPALAQRIGETETPAAARETLRELLAESKASVDGVDDE